MAAEGGWVALGGSGGNVGLWRESRGWGVLCNRIGGGVGVVGCWRGVWKCDCGGERGGKEERLRWWMEMGDPVLRGEAPQVFVLENVDPRAMPGFGWGGTEKLLERWGEPQAFLWRWGGRIGWKWGTPA